MFRKVFLFILFFSISFSLLAQSISICSWNLKNFGKSKTDIEIEKIADLVKDFDVFAIQEVVAGYGGAQAVARLADELNRKGSKWDYTISDPTKSSPYHAERYAYLWKTSRVKKIGDAWLAKEFEKQIEREPYLIRFLAGKKTFTLVSFHAIPKAKQPEREIKFFKNFPSLYPKDNFMFVGDFNIPQSHSVFNPLKKMGYIPVFKNQKTTLRQKCIKGDCLASELDNIFYNSKKVKVVASDVIHFYRDFNDVKQARLLSDHIPLYTKFAF